METRLKKPVTSGSQNAIKKVSVPNLCWGGGGGGGGGEDSWNTLFMLNFTAYQSICDLFESIHFSMNNGPV